MAKHTAVNLPMIHPSRALMRAWARAHTPSHGDLTTKPTSMSVPMPMLMHTDVYKLQVYIVDTTMM